jgi:hypothetical protein
MKKVMLLSVAVFAFAGIDKYLDAVKKIPDTKIDELMVKEMKINKKSVVYSLYPKVDIFANAIHYSNPASLRPLPPTEAAKIGMSGGGYPFSQNIEKIGFNISMPLFIKEIYDNKKKMEYLLKSTKYQAKLNLLKREALLIGEISNFNYLVDLKKALLKKKDSIKTTIKAIEVSVKVGRVPEFKLERLKDALLNIDIKIQNINNLLNSSKANIYKLTKLKIDKKVTFEVFMPKKQQFLALKPIENLITASKYSITASKDKYIPKLSLIAQGYRAFGKAYDNGKSLALNFANVGIYLNWEIFNKKNSSSVQKAKVEYMKNTLLFQKTLKDLKAQERELLANIKSLKKAILMAKKSVEIKKELLKSAKVAFKLNEMTVDEYLTYEDDLAQARADLANLIALKSKMVANLAFIYGENFKKVFK